MTCAHPKDTNKVLIRLLLSVKWVKQQEITAVRVHTHQSILWFIHFVNENENEKNNINGNDKGIGRQTYIHSNPIQSK